MDVLVDTSVWSLALRRRSGSLNGAEQAIERELRHLVDEGRVVMIGPVRQELLSGLRDQASYDRLRTRLRAFEDHPITTSDYEEAALIGNRCRAAGIAGSAIDFAITAFATIRDLDLFTTDVDFSRYATQVPLRLHLPRSAAQ